MKKSRRLIRNTLVAMGGLMVLYVGVNRLYAVDETRQVPRQSVTAAELAQLRGFSAVRVNGNLAVDIVQQADHAVEIVAPAGAGPAEFFASVNEETLILNGTGNLPGRVRVGMPALTRISADEGATLSVSGFTGENLSMQLGRVGEVVLRNNDIRHWSIVAGEKREVQIDRASIGAGTVEVTGRATLKVID